MIDRVVRGIARGVRARPAQFGAVTVVMLGLHVLLPPIVLSVARKPWDYFAFNPWLINLPQFLVSGDVPLRVRFEKLWNLALFWISASSPYGVEWGFAVDVGDLSRMAFTSLLVGVYFAVWRCRRARPMALRPTVAWSDGAPRHGALMGAFASIIGLTSGPCSVMGCGAPVIPVVGLAFAGLSSTTLKFLNGFSTTVTTVVQLGMITGIVWLAWAIGGDPPQGGDQKNRPHPAGARGR